VRHRRLGSTGTWVSEIGLGGNTFGRECDQRATVEIVEAALESGINFFDTADSYAGGRSEELLGRALAPYRHQVVLATKVGWPSGERDPNAEGLSRRRIVAALDASLRRLGTDHVDVYYLHQPDPWTPLEETLAALDDLVRAGKVRYPACSNYPAWQVVAMHAACREHHLTAPVVSQSPYNLLDTALEAELAPACQHVGMGIVAYAPLASGFLTGKYRRDGPIAAGRRGYDNPAWQRRWLDERNFGVLDRVREIAVTVGVPAAQVAIAWVLARPLVSSVLVGARNRDQLLANVLATDVTLTDRQLRELVQAQARSHLGDGAVRPAPAEGTGRDILHT
jgi:aryl-alcohol dehydrogenase-like predicted oxidoreductase